MAKHAWLYPSSAERKYGLLLRNYVLAISKETERGIASRELLRLDDWSSDLTSYLLEMAAYALGIGETVTARLPEVYAQINQFNDRQWRLVVKAGSGLDISESAQLPPNARLYGNVSAPGVLRARFGIGVDLYRAEPWLLPLQNNWVAQNVQLIKSIPEQYLSRVETLVRQGVVSGLSPKELAKQISEAGGVTLRRANIIARDQTSKANAQLSEYRMNDLGINRYIWTTSHDERVRPYHRTLDGKEFSFDKPPSEGNPGQPVLCIPGNSNIEIAHAVKKLWRRRCADNLAFLVTTSGKRIEATPNHPVLTNNGWKAIQDVGVGEYLVNTSDQSFHGVVHDIQRAPSEIGEIFDTVSRYVSINTSLVSELQFHGDHSNGEIDTIDIDGFLRSEDYASINKGFVEFFFANADMAFGGNFFSVDSSLEKAISTLWPASVETMRGCGKLLTFLNSEFGHSNDVRLTAISEFNSGLNKALSNCAPSDAKIIRKLKLANSIDVFGNNQINGQILAVMRLASVFWNDKAVCAESLGEVVRVDAEMISSGDKSLPAIQKFDCVVEKGLREFRGSHVYNLETESNWYSSNNLIIHNCRCWAKPVF